ncbi:unnamed protein product, partial [Adineta steineri]
GQDGAIHVFETKSDQVEHIRCADQCHCLAVNEYHLFVGTNKNELEVRSFPRGDSLSSLVHFTQPVSALCLSNSSLFIGTRDFKVVMMNLNDDSNKMKYFDGHQAPILALNVYEEKRWLATSCCDGSVRVFNIDKQTLVKQFNVITKSNDIETASSLVKIDWDKTDHMLAIPVKNMVQFYESDKWTRKKTYENDSIDEVINLISFSPCRTLFIISYVNGQLSIIDRLTFNICMNYSSKDAVCSLAWNPIESNRFTCSTIAGEYAHVDISEYLAKPTSTPADKELIPKWFEHTSSMIIETKPVELEKPYQSASTHLFNNSYTKKHLRSPTNETSNTSKLLTWKPVFKKSRLSTQDNDDEDDEDESEDNDDADESDNDTDPEHDPERDSLYFHIQQLQQNKLNPQELQELYNKTYQKLLNANKALDEIKLDVPLNTTKRTAKLEIKKKKQAQKLIHIQEQIRRLEIREKKQAQKLIHMHEQIRRYTDWLTQIKQAITAKQSSSNS